MAIDVQLSTGVPGLDRLLRGLIAGRQSGVASRRDRAFRAVCAPLLPARFGARQADRLLPVCRSSAAGARKSCRPPCAELDTSRGFEQLITEIHRVLGESGREACFVFDCLSMLADAWFSDRMLGNFFRLTCPVRAGPRIAGVFPAAAQPPFVSRRHADPQHDADLSGCVSASRGTVRASDQGGASVLAHDAHAARLGRGRLRAVGREFDDGRDPDVDSLDRAWIRCGCGRASWSRESGAGRAGLGGDPGRARGRRRKRRSAWTICCR